MSRGKADDKCEVGQGTIRSCKSEGWQQGDGPVELY